uniref:Secreted protein n=1 Tax=Utricularia reniformis TaxID=192314 RepID=A0A1Y0AYU4_9LAMI|nr:hypothetical protein AEK19_MT0811 [Utricularia reniformis]ART30317.1 hypothetical protein AEK19_MT0811 [Utricularia reniformis]
MSILHWYGIRDAICMVLCSFLTLGVQPRHGKPLDRDQHVAHIALSRKPRSMSDDQNDGRRGTPHRLRGRTYYPFHIYH